MQHPFIMQNSEILYQIFGLVFSDENINKKRALINLIIMPIK